MPASSTTTNSKREEIIEIASRLFYEQGFGATGIKQIIEEAGIAKGTFYSHFQSKVELGVAWLQGRHHLWIGWFKGAVNGADSPADKLLAPFNLLESWLKESDFRGCAFLNTMAETPDADHKMRFEVKAHKTDLHNGFRDLATAYFQDESTSGDEAAAKGSTIYLLFEGALIESQNFHETWPVESARAAVEAMLATKSSEIPS